jgi:hypothetical protein
MITSDCECAYDPIIISKTKTKNLVLLYFKPASRTGRGEDCIRLLALSFGEGWERWLLKSLSLGEGFRVRSFLIPQKYKDLYIA